MSSIFTSFFRKTLALAQELGDRAIEAQACYSLGNTYTLLRNYEQAIEYHLRHLIIAQQLLDRVGEGNLNLIYNLYIVSCNSFELILLNCE